MITAEDVSITFTGPDKKQAIALGSHTILGHAIQGDLAAIKSVEIDLNQHGLLSNLIGEIFYLHQNALGFECAAYLLHLNRIACERSPGRCYIQEEAELYIDLLFGKSRELELTNGLVAQLKGSFHQQSMSPSYLLCKLIRIYYLIVAEGEIVKTSSSVQSWVRAQLWRNLNAVSKLDRTLREKTFEDCSLYICELILYRGGNLEFKLLIELVEHGSQDSILSALDYIGADEKLMNFIMSLTKR